MSTVGDFGQIGLDFLSNPTQMLQQGFDSIINENIGAAGDQGYTSDTFPQDLSSSYYGHWMTITAMVPAPGATFTSPTSQAKDIISGATKGYVNLPGAPNTPSYTVGLFIPSDTGGGGGMM